MTPLLRDRGQACLATGKTGETSGLQIRDSSFSEAWRGDSARAGVLP